MASLSDNRVSDQHFVWMLVLSLGLHVLLLLSLPNLLPVKKPLPTILEVELTKAEAPAAVAQPEPTPQPPAPQKSIAPKPDIKPTPIKALPKSENVNVNTPKQAEQAAEPPPVMSVTPKAEVAPAVVAPPPPPPEPPKPIGPSPQEIDAARNQYGAELANALARYKQYPKIAQMRGYQGDVLVDVQMDGNGNVTASKIHQSSGFESLDNQALDMVKKASPLPPPPVLLRGRSFNVLVPVSFHLQD